MNTTLFNTATYYCIGIVFKFLYTRLEQSRVRYLSLIV